jgi:hypothetical protein
MRTWTSLLIAAPVALGLLAAPAAHADWGGIIASSQPQYYAPPPVAYAPPPPYYPAPGYAYPMGY